MSKVPLTPSFRGYIGSTKDALLVIQATLNNQLGAVSRRPHDRERSELIKSGNVFVFIEERSGIKRWTDGVAWSPSRILGRFLVYRELDRHALSSKEKSKLDRRKRRSSDLSHGSSCSTVGVGVGGVGGVGAGVGAGVGPAVTSSGSSSSSFSVLNSNEINRSLVGSLVASYAFREYGLIKKTLSLTINRFDQLQQRSVSETIHLVSYYSAQDVLEMKLQRPSDDLNLKNLQLSSTLWNAVKESSLGGKIPIEDDSLFGYPEIQNQPGLLYGYNQVVPSHPSPSNISSNTTLNMSNSAPMAPNSAPASTSSNTGAPGHMHFSQPQFPMMQMLPNNPQIHSHSPHPSLSLPPPPPPQQQQQQQHLQQSLPEYDLMSFNYQPAPPAPLTVPSSTASGSLSGTTTAATSAGGAPLVYQQQQMKQESPTSQFQDVLNRSSLPYHIKTASLSPKREFFQPRDISQPYSFSQQLNSNGNNHNNNINNNNSNNNTNNNSSTNSQLAGRWFEDTYFPNMQFPPRTDQ